VLLHPAGQWRSERSTLLFLILGCFFHAPHAFSWFWLRGLRASPNVCFVRRFEGMTNIFLSNLTDGFETKRHLPFSRVCVCARVLHRDFRQLPNKWYVWQRFQGRERETFLSFVLPPLLDLLGLQFIRSFNLYFLGRECGATKCADQSVSVRFFAGRRRP
jgi:hypothetical protein